MICSLIVLRAQNPEQLAEFYRSLGFPMVPEKHGSGPNHFACEIGGTVLEIYPQGAGGSTTGLRLGFRVQDVTAFMVDDSFIHSPLSETQWGYRLVVRDPEGHLIEFVQDLTPENEVK